MIRARFIRLVVATVVLAFGLGAAHAAVHEVEPPGSGPAIHGVACDDTHGEPRCPVCLGHAPHRNVLRSPTSGGSETPYPGLHTLYAPETHRVSGLRTARPEAARAPPRHS